MNLFNDRYKIYWILAGALLFSGVFWQEKMGLNTALYDMFLIVVLFSLYPKARLIPIVRWLLAGHLLCLAMVLVHNTELSKATFVISLVLLASFAEFEHRSVIYAGASMAENMLFLLPSLIESISRNNRTRNSRSTGNLIRYLIFPVIIVFLFFIFYYNGNESFSVLADQWINSISQFLGRLFNFSIWERILFFVLGLVLTGFLLLRNKLRFFARLEEKQSDKLIRVRVNRKLRGIHLLRDLLEGMLGRLATGIMALKHMNSIGVIALLLLNALLLLVNITDIGHLWMGIDTKTVHLYQMVHEGNNVLVVSILMAIGVVIVFFKGNLQFYQKNKWLRYAAYAWLLQNAFLVLSVGLRDYYYIHYTGLARNRIALIFFLALVMFGLITVAWKISRVKSVYFLFRVNAWAAIILFIGASTINWDKLIVNYNISHQQSIVMPVNYMSTLGPSVLPVLDKNREILRHHATLLKEKGFRDLYGCNDCWETNIDNRIKRFKEEQEEYSWLSWNLEDQHLKDYFKTYLHK